MQAAPLENTESVLAEPIVAPARPSIGRRALGSLARLPHSVWMLSDALCCILAFWVALNSNPVTEMKFGRNALVLLTLSGSLVHVLAGVVFDIYHQSSLRSWSSFLSKAISISTISVGVIFAFGYFAYY